MWYMGVAVAYLAPHARTKAIDRLTEPRHRVLLLYHVVAVDICAVAQGHAGAFEPRFTAADRDGACLMQGMPQVEEGCSRLTSAAQSIGHQACKLVSLATLK